MAVVITKCKSPSINYVLSRDNLVKAKQTDDYIKLHLYREIAINCSKVIDYNNIIKIDYGIQTSKVPENNAKRFFIHVLISYPDDTSDFLMFYNFVNKRFL